MIYWVTCLFADYAREEGGFSTPRGAQEAIDGASGDGHVQPDEDGHLLLARPIVQIRVSQAYRVRVRILRNNLRYLCSTKTGSCPNFHAITWTLEQGIPSTSSTRAAASPPAAAPPSCSGSRLAMIEHSDLLGRSHSRRRFWTASCGSVSFFFADSTIFMIAPRHSLGGMMHEFTRPAGTYSFKACILTHCGQARINLFLM